MSTELSEVEERVQGDISVAALVAMLLRNAQVNQAKKDLQEETGSEASKLDEQLSDYLSSTPSTQSTLASRQHDSVSGKVELSTLQKFTFALTNALRIALINQPALPAFSRADLINELSAETLGLGLNDKQNKLLCDEITQAVNDAFLYKSKLQPLKQYKNGLPKRSFIYDELHDLGDNKGVEKSSHLVTKMAFIDELGCKQIGFFKPCDSTYPPLLAKYAVAISLRYRRSLRHRHSEDRLVFDKEHNIIGTLSVVVKGDINDTTALAEKTSPLLKGSIPFQLNTEKKEDQGFIPFSDSRLDKITTEQLVDAGAADILLAAILNGEDDGHSGNFGLIFFKDGHVEMVKIDPDMSFYGQLTAWVKGERVVHGLVIAAADKAVGLKAEHFKNFPNNCGDRTFWVTYSPSYWEGDVPRNGNITKAFGCYKAFRGLADNEEFKQQLYFAMLKEIIAFQPQALEAELNDYLAGQPIGLDELPKEKKERLLSHNLESVFYQGKYERSFVEHFMLVAGGRQQYIQQLIANNEHFRAYLRSKPSPFKKVMQWLKAQNQSSNPINYSEAWAHQTYLALCRDSMSLLIEAELDKLSGFISKLSLKIEENPLLVSYTGPTEDVMSQSVTFMEFGIKTNELEAKKLQRLISARKHLCELKSVLVKHSDTFFSEKETTIKQRDDYILACKKCLRGFNEERLLRDCQPLKVELISWAKCFRPLIADLDFQLEAPKKPVVHRVKASTKAVPPSAAGIFMSYFSSTPEPVEKSIMLDLLTALRPLLKQWVLSCSWDEMVKICNQSLDDYQPRTAVSIFNLTRTRKDVLSSAIKNASERAKGAPTETAQAEIKATLLSNIFSDGGWKGAGTFISTGSYNTILVSKLFLEMFKSYRNDATVRAEYRSLQTIYELQEQKKDLGLSRFGEVYKQTWFDTLNGGAKKALEADSSADEQAYQFR